MDILILRLEGHLMSFGGPTVDRHGVIQPYPALSMLVGLLANALGTDHAESDSLQRLQERLSYAARQDRAGHQIRDYQTVDLSKPHMLDDRAWTTWGILQKRKGGSASTGTHERHRDYWADSAYTVAMMLDPSNEYPNLGDLQAALERPSRPLFIGRKSCLPSIPIFAGRMTATDLREALRRAPLSVNADKVHGYRAWFPAGVHADDKSVEVARPVTDRRDWANQIHVGERWIVEERIDVQVSENDHV